MNRNEKKRKNKVRNEGLATVPVMVTSKPVHGIVVEVEEIKCLP